jgi:putative heme-binding domain-containing protein
VSVAGLLLLSVLSPLAAQPAAAPKPAAAPALHELTLLKWSGELNIPDPVACSVDPQGRVYVTSDSRRKVGDLDIREHTMWIPDDVAMTSIDEKRAFLHRELAPGKMRAPRGGIADHNGDGSIDWKDLTFYSEKIYQVRDTNGDGVADKVTVFADGFNTEVTGIAAGVMYYDGWVYATIAPDLWRLKDTNDDGVADIREIVVHGFGLHMAYAGHDMHGLSVGPDGRIYWSIGDKGVNVTSKEGKKFFYPNEGCIMRIEPDGTGFEVYAHGTRNVQEPAFNEYGDLIGVDNDADQPGERERFVFLPETSDSGWRCNFQYMRMTSPWMREGIWRPKFDGQAAYFLPPILSYSDGPAGFKFEPGTALSDGQRGMFILNEFPSGKMKAFHATRDGATFRMTDERVLNEGIMGIGLSWDPDGSMMMADWIGGYPLDGIGALWRVDAKGPDEAARRDTKAILTTGFAQRPDAELVAQLNHRDQRVRQGAQLELAKRGKKAELLAAAAATNPNQLGRIHAIWGYGQLLRRGAAEAAPVLALLKDADPEIRRQAVKILGDAAQAAAKGQGGALIPLLADESPRVRLLAAIALGKFQEAAAVEPLFAMAEKDGADPTLRQGIVAGLEGCAPVARLAAAKSSASVPVRLVSIVALRRRAAPEVAAFLDDANPLVAQEAARAIHDDLSIPAALPALAACATQATRGEVFLRRAINASLRLGTPEAAARLVALGLDAAAPRAMRLEALNALKIWNTPPRLDLVDGRARTFQPQPIAAVLTPKLDALLALTDPGLKALAIEIMVAHQLKAGGEQIAAIVADPTASGSLRAQALRLMEGDRASPAFARALDGALAAGSPAPLHRAALELLPAAQASRLAAEVHATLATRSDAEKQHAIALLARAGAPATDAELAALGATLVAGTCAPALQLDVMEALQARSAANPALAAQLKAWAAHPVVTQHPELLAGGDATRGRDIVADHLAANCMACHSVMPNSGSTVGPNLRMIGRERAPAYLLEALLEPSAKLAPGFGMVNVTLKDKTEVTGTLASETPTAVTVRAFDGTRRTVKRSDIASQTPPASIMPPMGAILQPREIRDVVAYLSSLKGGRSRPATDEDEK